MKFEICFLLVVFASSQKLPSNIVGRGFDIVTAYPDSQSIEPGFKNNIISSTYIQKQMTDDGLSQVADQNNVESMSTCSFANQISRSTGSQNYRQNKLNQIQSREYSAQYNNTQNFAFLANQDFLKYFKDSLSYNLKTVESTSSCEVYLVTLNAQYNITNQFYMSVMNVLSNSDTNTAINAIFDEFGTHFIWKAIFGAQFITRTDFKAEDYQYLKDQNVDIDFVASQLNKMQIIPDYQRQSSYSQSDITSMSQMYISKAYRQYQIQKGQAPTQKELTWFLDAKSNPYPIKYEIKSISSLINSKNFPNVADINKLKQQFDNAFKNRAAYLQVPDIFWNSQATQQNMKISEHSENIKFSVCGKIEEYVHLLILLFHTLNQNTNLILQTSQLSSFSKSIFNFVFILNYLLLFKSMTELCKNIFKNLLEVKSISLVKHYSQIYKSFNSYSFWLLE